jgi:predicted dienelactone hydrolase
LFSPAVEGCDLSGFGADPGPADLDEALVWVDEMAAGEWVDLIDPELIGVMGHSAGGGSTASWGETQTRADALMVMAAPGVVERDVPTALFNGTCDGIIPYADVAAGLPALANGVQVDLLGAGHLAFSDLCALELGRLAEEKLAGRDDLNPALYGGLVQLATDGCDGYAPTVGRDECPGSFLANATSAPLVRGVVTDFFDQHLRGAEPTAFSSENLGFIAGP